MAKIEQEVKSTFANNNIKALVNILYTGGWLSNMQNNHLKPYGLSIQQYNILRILRGAKGELMTVHDIKSRMIDKSPNVTRLIDKLLVKKLITRDRCESDRRVVWVGISEKGLQLMAEIHEDFKDEDFERFLTEKEAEMLSDLLDKFRERFQEER